MRTFRHLPSLVLAVAPAALALGCSGSPPPAPDAGEPVPSSVQRDLTPSVAPGNEAQLVAGNTAFAFDLYHQVGAASPSRNLFYSPYSVSLALAMTYAGAATNTAAEMAKALHFTLPPASLHPAFDRLDLAIQKKPAGATGADGAPFAINIADSLWGDRRVVFQQSFVDTLARDYGAALRQVDFAGQPLAAEAAINQWVAKATDDKIDPLLGPGVITSTTRFVIVNAVYFNASWATQFGPNSTVTQPFSRADGSTVEVPMMSSNKVATAYGKGPSWQAVELPYSGGTTSMVIVLPDAGAFSAVEQSLSSDFWSSVASALGTSGFIALSMPRFKIHGGSVSLTPALEALGMKTAFDPSAADFTAMIPAGGTYISDVVHQAFVDVDESGTEAAAATAVVGTGLAIELPAVTVTVNRPFFFFIRDVATNTILFAGREGDPTSR
jgi:serpin B